MAINFNINPYYDDFNEAKGFHRILFRPGFAVQARELTQLQTELQDQINKFGKHIFVNGSVVLGGGRTFENDLLSIKLDTTYAGNSIDTTQFVDKIIVGQTSGTRATVKKSINLTTTDPITLIVQVISGGTFTLGENIITADTSYTAKIQSTNAFNSAMLFSVDSGIFFVDGNFVYAEAQTIAVDKYSNTTSKNIGFTVTESIVTSDEDESLLDRAQGSPNFAAPGADRYKVALTLISKDVAIDLDNFIELARIVDGNLVVNKTKTIYSEIGNELARRTFDESGDYTVKKWPLQILDHQSDTPDDTKFTVALDPGKGYIKGYEYETISQEFLTLDRARDTESVEGQDVNLEHGNYIYVNTINGSLSTNNNLYSTVTLNASGSPIGTAKVKHIQWASGTPGDTNAVYKLYLFDIQMNAGEIFGTVTSITSTTFSGTVNALSKVAGTGATFLSGSDSASLVFPLSNTFIESVSSGEYQFQRTYTATFTSGTLTINTANGNERFVGSAGALSSTSMNTYYHVVINDTSFNAGSTGYSNGQVIPFTTAGRSITIGTPVSGNPQSLTFNINDGSFDATVTIIATINANAQEQRSKTLSPYSIKIISSPNTTQGDRDSLAISDLYDVAAIYNTSTTNPTAVTIDGTTGVLTWNSVSHTEVTDNYIIDNGQRAEFYDHASLILNGTPPGATDYLLVVYRNFTAGSTGYFTKDSYTDILYENIPVFTDPSTGKEYQLRDCIDFRPRRIDGSTSFEGGQIPDPDSTFDCNYSYYLGRMDKIIATSDKTFVVKKGVPAIYPNVPTDESNGMSLYVIIIPPYTADIGDITIKYIDNKRYTMRDIGRLEKRIGNLEYYTQLSLLEKQAKDTSIPDASNIEKFKNGFVVDPFTSADIFASGGAAWSQRRWGWWNAWFNGSNTWNFASQNYNENSIAQAASSDFNAAIDPINQELRAPFTVNFSNFDYDSTDTDTVDSKRVGDLVSLDFTEVVALDQPLASTYSNINPFNVIRFLGSITLEPSFDQWVDVRYLPAINKVVDVKMPDAKERVIQNFSGSGNASRLVSTSSKTVTKVLGSSTTSLGANVVDVQFVPFIRNNAVIAIGTTFKPESQLYPYIENTNISQYIKPLTLIEVQAHTGTLFNGDKGVYESLSFRTGSSVGTQVGTAKTAIYSSPLTTNVTRRLLSVYDESGTIAVGDYVYGLSGGGSAQIISVTTYSLGDDLVPDEYGNIGFEFQIPANTFKTGERTIRLINNSTNDVQAQDSIGEGKYTAIGQIQTKQETILTTRSIQKQKVTTQNFQRYRVDPLAQSFFVEAIAYPQGFHLSSVDVYFRTKSQTVPVTMQIRRNVNGYPESDPTIPFSEVVMMPENVNISNDSSAATTFTFPGVIHLAPGEYSIVLLANTQEYEVFVAEMGQTVLGTTTKVDKQPYIGSLFKSQNASTWDAIQNQDLKFIIRRAQFVSVGSAVFNIQDPDSVISYQTIHANIASIAPTGTEIRWYAKSYYGSSTFDADWAPVDVNQDIDYNFLKQLAAASAVGGIPTLRLKADMTTSSDTVSPAIDLAGMSVVTALNTINNDSTGESGASTNGSALARYISKPINLADGFDASNINVTVDINKPSGTDVKVYYKILPSGATTPIVDEIWNEMVLESAVTSSVNSFDFKEHRYFPSGAFDAYGVPNDEPIGTRFNTFQIKIVMLSDNEANTPRLRDLRIIALDS
jgi:hypothetical protein